MRLQVSALLMIAGLSPAIAADLPRPVLKAPLLNALAAPGGFYVGVFASGGASKERFDFVSLPGTGSIYPNAFMGGAKVGYAQWNGSVMFGLEADVGHDIAKSVSNDCGIAMVCKSKGSWLLTQRLMIGNALGATNGKVLGIPSADQWPVPLSVPSSLAAANVTPYLTAGVAERRIATDVQGFGAAHEWLVGWVAGAGVRVPVAQAISLDVSYMYVGYNKSFIPASNPVPVFPTFKATSEQMGRVALTYGF